MMQDDDGRLVRAMTATMKELLDDSEFDPAYFARSALAAIEREGWRVVPVEMIRSFLDGAPKQG